MLEDIFIRYPQLELYLKSKHLLGVTELWKDSEGNDKEEIDIEEFKLALSHVDTHMKSLPATAQVGNVCVYISCKSESRYLYLTRDL